MVSTVFQMFHFLEIGRNWLNSTRYVCRLTSAGSKPTRAETEYQQQCTICYADFDAPVKVGVRSNICLVFQLKVCVVLKP